MVVPTCHTVEAATMIHENINIFQYDGPVDFFV